MIARVFLPMLLASVLLLFATGPANAQEEDTSKTIQQLVGEHYRYSIDFLIFKRLAEGELRFSETDQPNVYKAELIGRTLGIASWLAGDRTQTYSSLMALGPDGSLRSIEHVGKIVKRRWGKWQNRSRRLRYDYARGKVSEEKFKEGVSLWKKEHDIPSGQLPVDMLTAFYNLRSGVYGPLVRGTRVMIPTYSSKGFVDIEVSVLTVEQQAKQSYFPSHGLLIMATIDPEIFETGSGNLYFWFDDQGLPARGIVEDVIGLGDVRGSIDEEEL